MFKSIGKFFESPDDKDPSYIALVRNVLIFSILTTLAALGIIFARPSASSWFTMPMLLIIIGIQLFTLILVFQKNLSFAKAIVPLALTVAVTLIAINALGLHDISVFAYPMLVVIATLLQGQKATIATLPIIALGFLSVGVLDMIGYNQNEIARRTGIDDIALGLTFIIASSAFLNIITSRLYTSLKQLSESEQSHLRTNLELLKLQEDLEKRVAERTSELEESANEIKRRASQFEVISDISRTIASLKELDDLLPEIAEIISERFGFYHVGIFLMDEKREFAVLRASNSDGGRRMIARKHKLKVESSSLVGYAATRGESRIALDVGTDAVFFNNPDLPNTRSEAVIPLKIGSRIIGVLDVQSEKPSAFFEDDLAVLGTLANQVAIAIQNTSLYNETRQALLNAEKTYQQYVASGWQRLTQDIATVGYQSSGEKINALERPLDTAEVKSAQQKGETVITSDKKSEPAVAVPIKLRGQVIGVLNVRSKEKGRRWDEQELVLVRSLADRVALALENARLLQESQRRASKERLIGDIANKINSANTYQKIIATAVKELGMAISSDEVSIQFQGDQNK
jgi:GAF domain-containing protein